MITETMEKRIGIVGLGNMGGNIAERLHANDYELVLYNKTTDRYAHFKEKENVQFSRNIDDLLRKLRKRGQEVVLWLMIPGGAPTNELVEELAKKLKEGDIVIDASNAKYVDSVANYKKLKKRSISYLDVGCAGGPEDLLDGVSLMVGGDRAAFEKVKEVFRVVAGNGVYGYVGASGTGQMTKLVHNGIFYGIFPVYVEGVELLMKANEEAGGKLDVKEALRLLASSPPITKDIMNAILDVVREGSMPSAAPHMKVSEVIMWETEVANRLGVGFDATRAVLDRYGSISEESRRLYSAAKKKVTGH